MDHVDFACLFWVSAAAVAHHRQFIIDERHRPIFVTTMLAIVANVLAIGLHPNSGFLPICFALLAPLSCLYGIVGACRAGESGVPIVGLVIAGIVWIFAQIHPAVYPWSIFVGWLLITIMAWLIILDPIEKPEGVTRWSAFVLASSLLADLPGVFAWARTGRWYAENALSIVSAVILATLPTLWRLRTFARLS